MFSNIGKINKIFVKLKKNNNLRMINTNKIKVY